MLELYALDIAFSVCKVTDYSGVDIEQPFVFTGCTDEEKSLVCPCELVPENALRRDDGWRALRICGELEFSLIGVLAGISKVLAENEVGIFVISTYNTDYVLVKEENFEKAVRVLREAGYGVKTQPGSLAGGQKRATTTPDTGREDCILRDGDGGGVQYFGREMRAVL